MLKIEKFVTMSPKQWEIVIEGMRNPKNSWDRSDSYATRIEDAETHESVPFEFFVGDNDLELMGSLAKGGPVHAKYRRMMPVWMTINAPLYWWKEFDTYKVGTVTNSCSTMHKIHAKEFTMDDFSHEHLVTEADDPECNIVLFNHTADPYDVMHLIVSMLNRARQKFLVAKSKPMKEESKRAGLVKKYWWQMIQLLPTSYNQKRTVMLNYEVLHNIYISRRHHKLDEWHVFCDWIEELPYFDLIVNP
ncbi:MAG: hypothetical protein J6Q60_05750 [Bacteroidaceae bacterium]|nr:hypothetical protein [Bacteroidaceae bacterium]